MMSSKRKPYSSILLAKYIAAICNEKHLSLNITKIQKLLFLTYGVYLTVKRERLVDEHPEKWPYGPVFPKTREKLLKIDVYSLRISDAEFNEINNDEDLQTILQLIFKTFGNWSGEQLSIYTSKDDRPWMSPWYKYGKIILDVEIEPFFNRVIKYNE